MDILANHCCASRTDHEGSLTTLYANTPRDGMARLETMVLMADMDLPLIAIREQISSAVDLVVQQTRFVCGSSKVTIKRYLPRSYPALPVCMNFPSFHVNHRRRPRSHRRA